MATWYGGHGSPIATAPRRTASLGLLVLVTTVLLAAAGGLAATPAAAGDTARAVVDRWRARTPVHAVTVALGEGGQPVRTIASGHDAGEPVTARSRFRVGSVTKTFVATVIMQLVDEGRVRLDDPVSRHLPRTRWRDVTLRQLLTHTSGIPDYARATGLDDALIERPGHRWRTADVLRLVADRERDFPPGTGYGYSNTGYVLLGQIIEAVTGQAWEQALRRRVIDPLDLRDTFIAGEERARPGTVSGWYDTSGDGFDDRVNGPWPALETTEGPAGALVSTAPDLARFARALYEGNLVSPTSRRAMTAPQPFHPPHSNYGLGVELNRPDYRETVWGHGGALPGYRATMWYAPRDGRVIVVLANAWRCDPADLAHLLLVR